MKRHLAEWHDDTHDPCNVDTHDARTKHVALITIYNRMFVYLVMLEQFPAVKEKCVNFDHQTNANQRNAPARQHKIPEQPDELQHHCATVWQEGGYMQGPGSSEASPDLIEMYMYVVMALVLTEDVLAVQTQQAVTLHQI